MTEGRFHPCAQAVLFLACALAGGCHCSGEMKRFNITATLPPTLRNSAGVLPSVEVDLIGVGPNELQAWSDENISQYFSPVSDVRNAATASGMRRGLLLGQAHPSDELPMDRKDVKAMWDVWKDHKVMYLVILSNYPRLDTDQPGEKDPRRRIVPLDCARWDNEKTLTITVRPNSGLSVEPAPPRPQ